MNYLWQQGAGLIQSNGSAYPNGSGGWGVDIGTGTPAPTTCAIQCTFNDFYSIVGSQVNQYDDCCAYIGLEFTDYATGDTFVIDLLLYERYGMELRFLHNYAQESMLHFDRVMPAHTFTIRLEVTNTLTKIYIDGSLVCFTPRADADLLALPEYRFTNAMFWGFATDARVASITDAFSADTSTANGLFWTAFSKTEARQ